MIGKTILHYKILEKLGEGGMGVVYKAEDSRLERTVAIKFLPHQIAGNSEVSERFKIEAKAAAALNHPNIATIHAIEEVDGELFIVMEYIEGRELKSVMDDGQLSSGTRSWRAAKTKLCSCFSACMKRRSPSSMTSIVKGKAAVAICGLPIFHSLHR